MEGEVHPGDPGFYIHLKPNVTIFPQHKRVLLHAGEKDRENKTA